MRLCHRILNPTVRLNPNSNPNRVTTPTRPRKHNTKPNPDVAKLLDMVRTLTLTLTLTLTGILTLTLTTTLALACIVDCGHSPHAAPDA